MLLIKICCFSSSPVALKTYTNFLKKVLSSEFSRLNTKFRTTYGFGRFPHAKNFMTRSKKKVKKFTILRSPHIYKKAKETFYLKEFEISTVFLIRGAVSYPPSYVLSMNIIAVSILLFPKLSSIKFELIKVNALYI